MEASPTEILTWRLGAYIHASELLVAAILRPLQGRLYAYREWRIWMPLSWEWLQSVSVLSGLLRLPVMVVVLFFPLFCTL